MGTLPLVPSPPVDLITSDPPRLTTALRLEAELRRQLGEIEDWRRTQAPIGAVTLPKVVPSPIPEYHTVAESEAGTQESDFVEAGEFEDALNNSDSFDGSIEGEASFEYVGGFFRADEGS